MSEHDVLAWIDEEIQSVTERLENALYGAGETESVDYCRGQVDALEAFKDRMNSIINLRGIQRELKQDGIIKE